MPGLTCLFVVCDGLMIPHDVATTERLLLLGGSGQLGSEILARWSNATIASPSHSELDIADRAAVARAVDSHNATLLVNCAAFHNVDTCETQPEIAYAINATAVDAMAAIAEEREIGFVTISTDYVFDGALKRPYAEDDAPHPLSVYAQSKLAGEKLVLDRGAQAFVVRTCGVYGPAASKSKGTFIDRVINQAKASEPISAVDDVVASPTYAGHLADALAALVKTKAYGLYHAVNVGAITWYEYARKTLELAGIEYPIEPMKAADWKVAARRPSYSALANRKLGALGIVMPTWEEGIAAYLRVR